MFKVKDKSFDIKYAYLDAYVDEDELVIGLQIKAIGTDEYPKIDDAETEGLFFSDNELLFNSEVLMRIKPNEINNWQDIVGKKVQWNDYPEDEEEPHAIFYVYEHEGIYNANIEFKKLDKKIIVSIKATCDIYAGKEFSDNLPLEIETEVDFFGILCGKNITKKECENKIKPFLNLDSLKFIQNKYNVSIMTPINTDMETNLLVLGDY
ncbi:hypothetical protein FUAX_44980 (plasmid) [Fulvitalea axinellae]|uniref:Uncharacterized protein n=1 Tax=Fulvitalea axinellae TaxID=1182444 RepID=A0AAU9CIW9_9BACT|nr:hypothetical protein FUAX_44980 [Fulvitalea axinellae]